MSNKRCPSETTLRLFNDGCLSSKDIDQIAIHLERCELCLSRMEELEAGPLEQGIRIAATESARPEGRDDSKIESNAQSVLEAVFPEAEVDPSSYYGSDLFRLDKEVGVTSIGRVFMATDLVMDRQVKIIIPYHNLIASVDHRAQFTLDGKHASWLKHDNILRITQFGSWDEQLCYLAMPEIVGWPLSDIVNKELRLNLYGVLNVFGQICAALRHAHRHNVVHRHLNPNNIYIDRDLNVWVAEFGLVYDGRYQFELIEPLTEPTRYNSPESIRNDPSRINHRTDIFSLGAILDDLLNLTLNLDNENEAILRQVARKSQRNSRRKRFQSVEQVINEVGDRIRVS